MYTTCVLVSVQRWENHTFGTESNTCHSSTWGWRCLCDLNSSLLMNFLSSLRIRALRRSIGSDRRRTVGIHMCHRKVKWFSVTRALRDQILSRVVTSVGGNSGFYAGPMPCFILRLWLETTTMGGLHPDQDGSRLEYWYTFGAKDLLVDFFAFRKCVGAGEIGLVPAVNGPVNVGFSPWCCDHLVFVIMQWPGQSSETL